AVPRCNPRAVTRVYRGPDHGALRAPRLSHRATTRERRDHAARTEMVSRVAARVVPVRHRGVRAAVWYPRHGVCDAAHGGHHGARPAVPSRQAPLRSAGEPIAIGWVII